MENFNKTIIKSSMIIKLANATGMKRLPLFLSFQNRCLKINRAELSRLLTESKEEFQLKILPRAMFLSVIEKVA